MKKNSGYLIVLAIIFWFSGISQVNAQNLSLSGQVMDAETQNTLTGATVMIFKKETESRSKPFKATITNRKGNFTFSNLEKGSFQLMVSFVGYETFKQDIKLQQSKQLTISLAKELVNLGEVIVSSLHQDKMEKNVAMPVEIMHADELEKAVAFSPAEALENEPGISMKNDAPWATSLNIRGMNEKRIVALVDGNRIETASDLAAGLSMVDFTDLERIEVIKGASSLLYGTGAMGGVVNFISKKAHYADQFFASGNFQGGYQSVNQLFSRKVTINTGAEKWNLHLSGKMRDAENIQTPEGELPNSQFTDNNISVAFGLRPFQNHELNLQFQRFFGEDIGIPGGSAFPGPAEATYPKEKRLLYSGKYTITNPTDALENISLKYYHQYILRDVELIPNIQKITPNARITPQKTLPKGNHYTDGIQLKTNWSAFKAHDITAGFDLWQRRLETSREKYIMKEPLDAGGNPVDTINIIRGEEPIPDAVYGNAGVFLQDQFSLLDDKLNLTLGLRYDLIRVSNEKALDPIFLIIDGNALDPIPNQRITFPEQTLYNKSWSANIGMLYALTNDMDLTLSMGRSFRAPSIEERYKYIDLGNMVKLGDPDLKPEEGYSLDLGLRIWKPKVNIKINGFLNSFSNMIVEKPGEFVYTYNTGVEEGTQDTLPALINSNVSKALLYGFDMQTNYNIVKNTVLYAKASFVRGKDTKNEENLPLIPPLNGIAGIKYHIPGIAAIDLSSSMYNDQNKTAEGEQKTRGYAIYNLVISSAEFDLNMPRIKFTAGVKNIFDRAYRNHLSTNRGIINTEPGRNYFIKTTITF